MLNDQTKVLSKARNLNSLNFEPFFKTQPHICSHQHIHHAFTDPYDLTITINYCKIIRIGEL